MSTTINFIEECKTVVFEEEELVLYFTGVPGPQGKSAERTGSIQLSSSEAIFGTLSAGDSKGVARIPVEMNGMVLYAVGAGVSAASSSGPVTVNIRRVRAGVGVDMLSTPITIDEGEYDSSKAAVEAVINPANATVQTGDMLHFDVDSAGGNVLGLVASFSFQPA